MSKKINIQKKPQPSKSILTSDNWVSDRGGIPEQKPSQREIKVQMKRFTIDVPIELHTTIKKTCAERGTKMADEIRIILSNHYKS